MIVVCAANRTLYPHVPTMLNSLLTNSGDCIDHIYILAEDGSISNICHPLISVLNIHNYEYIIDKNYNTETPYSFMALARCYFPFMFPNISKLLYLDIDLLVLKSLKYLDELDMTDISIAAVKQSPKYSFGRQSYFNSGVMVMNLDRIRKTNAHNQILKLLRGCHMTYPDQDALNFIIRDPLFLDPVWNCNKTSPVEDIDAVYIKHFAGDRKPWMDGARQDYIDLWNQYKTEKLIKEA